MSLGLGQSGCPDCCGSGWLHGHWGFGQWQCWRCGGSGVGSLPPAVGASGEHTPRGLSERSPQPRRRDTA